MIPLHGRFLSIGLSTWSFDAVYVDSGCPFAWPSQKPTFFTSYYVLAFPFCLSTYWFIAATTRLAIR